MDLNLSFTNGKVDGEGSDDIGKFVITGLYDPKSKECHWTKKYVGEHDVYYRGFREGKGIWGTWEIDVRGGFHIWPLSEREGEAETDRNEQEEPVEAKGILVTVGSCSASSPQAGMARSVASSHSWLLNWGNAPIHKHKEVSGPIQITEFKPESDSSGAWLRRR